VLFVKPDARGDLPEYLIVRDQFTASKRHRYTIRYHLAPDCDAEPVITGGAGGEETSHIEARHTSGGALTIRVICETNLEAGITANVTEGWVSTCYAQYAPAPVAVFEAEGSGPQEFLTLIFPGSFKQIAGIEEQILKQWGPVVAPGFRRKLQAAKTGQS
jgi:hypothetical protein